MRLIFDIETNGLLDSLTVIHSLVLRDADTGELVASCARVTHDSRYSPICYGVKLLTEADEIIGHNVIKFDLPAIQKVYPSFAPQGRVTDTLVCSRLIWSDIADRDYALVKKGTLPSRLTGSHSLEAWGYRLGVLKGDFGKATHNTKSGDAWAVWSQEMQTYCEQDTEVTLALWRRVGAKDYSPQAIDLEHQFASIMAKQERHGFAFDKEAAQALYVSLVERRLSLKRELQEAFPPKQVETVFIPKVNNKTRGYVKGVPITKVETVEFNPSSRQMIAERLKALGWQPEEFTDTGIPKVDETILSKLDYPEAKLLAEHFLVEKRIGQLAEGDQAWLKLERKGRIHGSVNTNGAVTGRCTHSNPNVAQVPRVGSAYGKECRSLFTVRPGYSLVGADLAGLELRCLAHYMARYDDGAYGKVLLEGDIHTENQKAAGLETRNQAKTFIYAFLYGAGDEKVGSIVEPSADPDRKKAIGRKLKTRFLNQTPALKRLREDVGAAVDKKGHLRGLDGRLLHVRSSHAALNTLLQSAGALIAKQATVIAYEDLCTLGYAWGKDFAFVAHVHDEVQVEARKEIAEDVGRTIVAAMRKAGEFFAFRCPIDGEFKIGGNWAETH